MQKRVFVTGMGIISAIGNNTEETLASLKNMKSGIGRLSLFDSIHADIPVAQVPASNKELGLLAGVDPDPMKYTRNALLALIAAGEALRHSTWKRDSQVAEGLAMATTVGGMDLNEKYYRSLLADGTNREIIMLLDSSDCTLKVAELAGVRHQVTTISTACSSSANSIMLGARMIRNNKAERMIVGGSDALTKFTLNGFFALEILSPTGCRPFDKNRNGLTIGEGAAVLVLESEDVADPAKIICEITGYANANEAFHATASSADGLGARMAMSEALETAKLKPGDISYVNAHGTGTEINDLSEGIAVGKIYGGSIPPVSSTKSFTGHTLGAAGAMEAVFSILAMQNQLLLPNLNFTTPMDELAFQPVTKPVPSDINHVMSNSFGFGGNNTSLIFSRVK
jgi:3-oxoacyl-[acyl-carrier-protein] synthase II